MQTRNACWLLAGVVLAFSCNSPKGGKPASVSESSASVRLRGHALGPEGRPLPGVTVAAALVGDEAAAPLVTTSDASGSFEFSVHEGRYRIAAAADGYVGNSPTVVLVPQQEKLVVRLVDAAWEIAGSVREAGSGKPLPNATVTAANDDADPHTVAVRANEQGKFTLPLPAAGAYELALQHDRYVADPIRISNGQNDAVELVAYSAKLASERAPWELIRWAKDVAVPLKSADPQTEANDLEPVGRFLEDVKVVALGEATHGTREFFQLKHRFLSYLASEKGFNVLVMEANWSESLAVDRYLREGEGDIGKALAGMHFWTWDTEEVLAMLHWIRQQNSSTTPAKKIRFFGIDMQYSSVALRETLNYLRKVDPGFARRVTDELAPLSDDSVEKYRALDEERRRKVRAAIELVRKMLEQNESDYVKRSSEEAWLFATQHARTLGQAEHYYTSDDRSAFREQAMADNFAWLLESLSEDARIVLWAHNSHIARAGTPDPLGEKIAASLGERYYAVAFMFGQGSFQARDDRLGSPTPNHLVEHSVGAPATTTVEAALERVGAPYLFLDLRQSPKEGTVAKWLSSSHPTRAVGSTFRSEFGMYRKVTPAEEYDALVFVRETHRAQPTPTGMRPLPGEEK